MGANPGGRAREGRRPDQPAFIRQKPLPSSVLQGEHDHFWPVLLCAARDKSGFRCTESESIGAGSGRFESVRTEFVVRQSPPGGGDNYDGTAATDTILPAALYDETVGPGSGTAGHTHGLRWVEGGREGREREIPVCKVWNSKCLLFYFDRI